MSAALAQSMRHITSLLQAGRYDEAQRQLAALVTANPQFVEGLRLLAGTAQALGDFTQAMALLRRALAIDPEWTPTLTGLGELLLLLGRSAEAVPLLQRATMGSPPAPRAALLLSRHHLDAGQPLAALETASPWCTRVDLDADLAALHVAAYAALGRQGDAVTHYRRLLERAPASPGVAHGLANALNAANQAAEGEHVARQALRGGRPTAELYHTHARSLIALQRFEQAEAALRDCISLGPRQIEAHNSLAQLIWMRTGDIRAATHVLDQVLEKFGHDDALWAAKAALLQGAGDSQGAYACLAPRAARAQATPALLIRTGLAALEFEPATALALAKRALRAQPGNPTARKLACAGELGVGDGERALRECALLLQAAPDDQYLIAMQATALRLLHDPRYEVFCDYDRMVFSEVLETPAGWPSLASFLTEVGSRLSALHNPHGHRLLYQSLREGTETTQDLSRSEDPVIHALFQAFAAPLARYRERIGQGDDALRRRNRGGARFNGGWSVRLRAGGYHKSHVHPRGWISSACYIQLPGSMTDSLSSAAESTSARRRMSHSSQSANGLRTADGTLSFGAPGMITSPPLAAEFSVRPELGQLVLFPSYFWHGTLPFHSVQPRLTVAFDVVPTAR